MTDDEQTLTALEDELRTLAARDRDGAGQLAADMTERMLACIQTECRRQRLLSYLRRAGSVAALLAVLAVAGVLLVPTGGEPALVNTPLPETGQPPPQSLSADTDSLPVPQPVHRSIEIMSFNEEATDDAPVPESMTETAPLAVATTATANSRAMPSAPRYRASSMPTPVAGGGVPASYSLRKSMPEPSLQERVLRILTTQEQPCAELHAALSQAPTRSLQLNCGNCSLNLTTEQNGAVVIIIQQPGCEDEVITLTTPSAPLPPKVRELLHTIN
ncbi:MAG: hypothetical protein IJ503_04470 [Akkermansia sp.]|nr:hypothetical protein [Akkermansia sp.]